MTGDQRVRELLLPVHELEPIRLELVVPCAARVQHLSLCDEYADRFLQAFDASHLRSPSRL